MSLRFSFQGSSLAPSFSSSAFRLEVGRVLVSLPTLSRTFFLGPDTLNISLEERPNALLGSTHDAQQKVSSRCGPSGDGSQLLAADLRLSKPILQNDPAACAAPRASGRRVRVLALSTWLDGWRRGVRAFDIMGESPRTDEPGGWSVIELSGAARRSDADADVMTKRVGTGRCRGSPWGAAARSLMMSLRPGDSVQRVL